MISQRYRKQQNLNCLNPFGIGDDNIDFIFEKIKDRDPVFTCGLHTDIMAIIIEKPLLEFKNGIVKSGKAFLLIRRLNTTSGFDDCGNEKRFVNIDTTTGLVSNFHSQTPFVKSKKPLTELPHN